MKTRIEKLMAQYQGKIDFMDSELENISKEISAAREEADQNNLDEYIIERRVAKAQRQAYVQAKSDIESLLDYVT